VIAALLIAGAAFAHATWNIAMKRAGTSGTPFIAATVLVGVVVFAPIGVPALLAAPPVGSLWLPLVLGSALLQVVYFLVVQRAYRRADVGVVYPLARGTGPLLSVAGAVLLLGERPSAVVLAGVVLVVAGVVVIGVAGAAAGAAAGEGAAADAGARGSGHNSRPDAGVRRWRGIRYGVLVGVIIAAYTLWDAAAVTRAELEPVGYYWASMVVQLALLLPASLRQRGALVTVARAHPVAVILVGVLSPLAYVAVLMAYQWAPVSVVAPAREVSVVLIALASWLLLREPHPAGRIAGSVVVVAGIALLAVG
jgi:drug/metabolite transporter (DMT)-like permease